MKSFPYPVFSLLGLILDIVGAFFLSIEAIGTEKISKWELRIFKVPSEELSNPTDTGLLSIARIMTGVYGGIGTLVGALCSRYIEKRYFAGGNHILAIVISITPIMLFCLFATFIIPRILKSGALFLEWTQLKYKNGEIGLIGFSFLFIGFFFQFLGTLLPMLFK